MIGTTVSHYRVTAKLGEGGMGAVYGAEDLQLRRPVALKFLSGQTAADPQARQRLVKEAQAASRLNHPNIATIYEVHEGGDTPFIAMEQVSGESLKQVLSRGSLPPKQLLEIARQIAEGLNEAHQAGVLHRDIKPGNIMLDAKGRVKILDFGLAAFAAKERAQGETEESFITRTASTATTGGTVPYMSPEQLRGEPTDARSDIFSFGVMLYECLTGRLPFRGETSIDILHAILRQTPTPVRSLVSDISPEWEQLVERCLAKAAEQRFPSMKEVLSGLERTTVTGTSAEKSLAVLYFENLSGKKEEDEYFRDGITEDLITELLKIKGLRVFTRSAVLPFRDKPVPAPQVGRELNAAYVLEGSLRRAGDRLRINAQLLEIRSGHGVWAERFDRKLEDVFTIQDEIVQSIAKALRVMLTEKEKEAIAKAPTADVKAYDYYLRGRQFFHQFRRRGYDFARQMFTRAIELDPGYARAYAGIADCYSYLYMYWDASQENLKAAEEASHRALLLDPELAEAHVARGLAVSLSKQYDDARIEFETAIRLDPKQFEAYYFNARACFQQGKLEEAARLFEKASEVNPDDYQAPALLGTVYIGLDRKADAEVAYRRAYLAAERHLELHPDDARALYLGAGCLARLGERARSLDWAGRALAIDPEDCGILYNVACTYALQGKSEEAIDCLEKAMKHAHWYKRWIEHDSDLDSLRSHPRFQALLERS
jgi:non-specific serine/threonine protein kinase